MIVQYDEKFAEKLDKTAKRFKEKYRLNEKDSEEIARIVLLEQKAKDAGTNFYRDLEGL